MPHEHETDEYKLALETSDIPKWAAWKVTVATIIFCCVWWGGLWYIAIRMFG